MTRRSPIDRSTALSLARARVQQLRPDLELVVIEDEIIEKPYGWIFCYADRRWLETGELRFALGGNAPFLIERDGGAIVELGTARPLEDYLKAYETR